MLFVTFNDYPGGIYYSQVIDVVEYLSSISSKKVRLIAFVSIRNYWDNCKKIKNRYSDSFVIPMFPGVKHWRWNRIWMFILGMFFFRNVVICRGVFAYHIVYPFRKTGIFKRIVLDARGAYKAEFEEYKVIDDVQLIDEVAELERRAVLTADEKIAVSNALVNYWSKTYNYSGKNHLIIPCTLSKDFVRKFPEKYEIDIMRRDKGFSGEDIIIVFSGSSSGWQSLNYSDELFLKLFDKNEKIKLVFLGQHQLNEYGVYKKYPDRILQKQVENKDVLEFLYIADYGWLVREQSITNQVASPVKFAEYLSAGLKVLISDNLGDYSLFCEQHECGFVIKNDDLPELKAVAYDKKIKIHDLSCKYFIKESYKPEYQKLLELSV